MIHLLAQTSSSGGGNDVFQFLQYGALGAIVLALLFGFLWPKPAVDGIKEDKRIAEQQRNEMVRVYQDEFLPALNQIAALSSSLLDLDAIKPVLDRLMRELVPLLEEVNDRLAEPPPARRANVPKKR